MIFEELKRIENSIFKTNHQQIKNLIKDSECEEYLGFNFQLEKLNIKFRKAKITPKKVGLFVTLWKRNTENETEPFNENDNFDFYIIVSEQKEKFGFFLFPKKILCEKQIITTKNKEGKRGFRVYPSWTQTENKQAEKTQSWQIEYFIELTNLENINIEKFKSIINSSSQEM
ncbi:MepB family protein [Cloacibacterium sp.]|uniref:MepB family protein n=1 Tax=Cloacibacterium sp. TaxID=1913682 RepID=UPI0039E58847